MTSLAPTPKVTAATVGGAVAVLAVYVLGLFGVALPEVVSAALTVVAAAVAGYFQPDSVEE